MDAARLAVDYLNASGLGAAAYYEVPETRPSSFLVVEQTGGGVSERVLHRLYVDVDCWAPTRRAAAELAERVMAALASMPDEEADVFGASVTSTYHNPDPDSGTPRFTVGTEIVFNG